MKKATRTEETMWQRVVKHPQHSDILVGEIGGWEVIPKRAASGGEKKGTNASLSRQLEMGEVEEALKKCVKEPFLLFCSNVRRNS